MSATDTHENETDQTLPPGAIVPDAAPAVEEPTSAALGAITNDVNEATLIISAPSGKGEKEIPASLWPRYAASARHWVIKHTNYVGAHHSDEFAV